MCALGISPREVDDAQKPKIVGRSPIYVVLIYFMIVSDTSLLFLETWFNMYVITKRTHASCNFTWKCAQHVEQVPVFLAQAFLWLLHQSLPCIAHFVHSKRTLYISPTVHTHQLKDHGRRWHALRDPSACSWCIFSNAFICIMIHVNWKYAPEIFNHRM